MNTLKQQPGSALLCLLEILVGILLLGNPVGFTSGIIISFGIILLLIGLINILKYFRANALEAAVNQGLFKGLVLLLIGGFCTFRSYWFIITFPIITIVYGIAILIAGLGKVQWAADMLRLKKGKWYIAAISAALSIICAIVILSSPFTSTAVLWMFTGISLIVEGVIDIVSLLIRSRE